MIVGGVILFIIGAVAYFALEFQVSGVDVSTIGAILMGGGVILFIVGLIMEFQRRNRVTESRTVVDENTGEAVRRDKSSGGI